MGWYVLWSPWLAGWLLAVYIRIWAVANYLVANYPRIVVVGYIQPQWFTWDKERVNPLQSLGWTNPLTSRGMNNQVGDTKTPNKGSWMVETHGNPWQMRWWTRENARHMWSFPEVGVPLNHPFKYRICHDKQTSYWWYLHLSKPPIWLDVIHKQFCWLVALTILKKHVWNHQPDILLNGIYIYTI